MPAARRSRRAWEGGRPARFPGSAMPVRSFLPGSFRPPALSLQLDQQPDLTFDLAVEGGFLALGLGPPVGQRGEQGIIGRAAGRGLPALVQLALLDHELPFLGDEAFEPLRGLPAVAAIYDRRRG